MASTSLVSRSAPRGVSDERLGELAARLRLAITRTARRLRQEAGTELSPSQTRGAGDDRAPRAAHPERAGRAASGSSGPTATRIARPPRRRGADRPRRPTPPTGAARLVSVNADGRERLRRLRGRKNAYLARRMRDLTAEDVETLERAAEILERMLEGERAVSRPPYAAPSTPSRSPTTAATSPAS